MSVSQSRKDKILLAALPHIPFDGWSLEALSQGAREAGFKPSEAVRAFPLGESDLLDHFADWAQRQMLERIARKRLIHLKIRERVGLCVRSWFEVVAPYKDAIGLATRSAWQPRRGWMSVKALAQLCNAIWYECGDNATDFNFYTKRALLGAVITSTLFFWLRDDSDTHVKTWEFLDDRIDNVMQVGKKINELKNAGSALRKATRFMKSQTQKAA